MKRVKRRPEDGPGALAVAGALAWCHWAVNLNDPIWSIGQASTNIRSPLALAACAAFSS